MKYNKIMRKICVFLCCFVNLLFSSFNLNFCNLSKSHEDDFTFALAERTTYAKALVNCTLYKSPSLSDELKNIYFIVPESYFVTVLENVSDTVMKVQYDRYVGYVNSTNVLIATFIPIVKTLDGITCDIKETVGTQVWNIPSATDGTSLTVIDAGTKNIKYIAMVYGTIPIGGESNLWYYVNYTPAVSSTNVYEGYVYSENVTNVSEIVMNAESNPEIITSDPDGNTDGTLFISSPIKTLIIAVIAVPIILLAAILIYKAVRRMKDYSVKKRNIQKEVSQAFESENYQPYNDLDTQYNSFNGNRSLKGKIDEMKHTSFVRKQNGYGYNDFQGDFKSNRSYPEFPTYDSEDDLL